MTCLIGLGCGMMLIVLLLDVSRDAEAAESRVRDRKAWDGWWGSRGGG
jgi:hypothetical protein